jgi:phospholipid/cholesterol/gamma-HCH transport system substrate-binding protein
MAQAQKYGREEIKAGAVVLGSLGVLVALIVLVSRGGFQSTPVEYRIEFASVGGLEEGAQVRLGGVKVGRVLRVVPPGQASPRVQVTVGLRKDVVLRAGTEASLTTLGLVGEHYIELSNPKPGPGEIPPGGLIAAREQPSLSELVVGAREMGEAAKAMLARIQEVVDGPVRDFVQRASRAMDSGDRALRGLEQTLSLENREHLRKSLAAVSAVLEENRAPLRTAVADLGTLVQKMDEAVDPKGGDLKGTLTIMKADLERTREVLDNMDRAITNFDRAVTGNLEAFEETLANLRRASQNARELTQSLKERPWQALFPAPLKDRDGAR